MPIAQTCWFAIRLSGDKLLTHENLCERALVDDIESFCRYHFSDIQSKDTLVQADVQQHYFESFRMNLSAQRLSASIGVSDLYRQA